MGTEDMANAISTHAEKNDTFVKSSMGQSLLQPYIIDLYPLKAQYASGDKAEFEARLHNPTAADVSILAIFQITELDAEVWSDQCKILLPAGSTRIIPFTYLPDRAEWKCFGADLSIYVCDKTHTIMEGDISENDRTCYENSSVPVLSDRLSTAFDIAESWKKAPRYGFLCDFGKQDENDRESVAQLAKYHLNVIQFYDWMYRHDDLVPHEEYYQDPLNRSMSLIAVKNRIRQCHEHGMKTMAYGAVYASDWEFYLKHPEWALYDNRGKVQNLGGWLVIMNIGPQSSWSDHIIQEYIKALTQLDFDGIQMDTYGFPKTAFSMNNGRKHYRQLEEDIHGFINKARKELEMYRKDAGIFFNAVNNWPANDVAEALTDASYIEVWPPNDRYISLYNIINNAREKGHKPVILAAYLPAFKHNAESAAVESETDGTVCNGVEKRTADAVAAENGFLLLSAVIFASGGYHIMIGENNCLLSTEYFAAYVKMRGEFVRTVRNYYDFIVRYGMLLYDLSLVDISMTHATGINGEFTFEASATGSGSGFSQADDMNNTQTVQFSSYGEAGKVWTIVRKMPGYYVINMINLTEIDDDMWRQAKPKRPKAVPGITLKIMLDEEIEGVLWASPDFENGRAEALEFAVVEGNRGNCIRFDVPVLDIWDLVYIRVRIPE